MRERDKNKTSKTTTTMTDELRENTPDTVYVP